MKKTLKKFLIILISSLVMLNISFSCYAVNETVQVDENMVDSYFDGTNNEIEGISLDANTIIDNSNTTIEDEIHDDNFYDNKSQFTLSSNDVNISEGLLGDIFIISSGTVTIDSYVSGNVFVCAKNVEVTNNANIGATLFCASDTLSIDGNINGSVYAVSQSLNLKESTYIICDLFVASDTTTFAGYIGRNVHISCSNIEFSENTNINGNFNYSSNNEINIPEKVVKGKVNYTKYEDEDNTISISQYIYSFISFIVVAIILYVIFRLLKARFIDESKENFVSNLPKYILFGILGLIVPPIAFVILLMLNVTISLAFMLLALYLVFMMISSSVAIIALSQLVVEKLKDKIKLNDTAKLIITIIILSIIYKLLQLVPIFGFIVTLIIVVIGLGIFIKNILPEKNN